MLGVDGRLEMIVEKRVVVAAALVDDLARPTRLLAARRSKPKTLRGRWEFPGGKIDDGETVIEAVHREIREELGIDIELGDEVLPSDGGTWPLTEKYVMRLWWAQIASGEPQPLVEHDELRWLDLGTWLSVPWLDPDIPIVSRLIDLNRQPVA